ncbi:MAG: hypothetical protein CYPHOPRED_003069 [Cyphobasidiales sp. Tagirdzhanova-0007]|nr:MAG: hypothetical protein CYPHOPRED_003069 [Cyphobasidiales sp. Tagirdzhanova-0007]
MSSSTDEPHLPSSYASASSSSAQRRSKPSSPGTMMLGGLLKRVALVGFLAVAVWWLYVWRSGVVQDFFDPKDPIHISRPHFRYVEPYSDKHRYRPAASPIIKEKGKNGQIKYRGKYT